MSQVFSYVKGPIDFNNKLWISFLAAVICDHSALWAVLWPSLSWDCLLCVLLFMDLIALYNTLQKLITPESHTSLFFASAELLWPSSLPLKAATSEQTAATLESISLNNKKKKSRYGSCYAVWNKLHLNHPREELITHLCSVTKQSWHWWLVTTSFANATCCWFSCLPVSANISSRFQF